MSKSYWPSDKNLRIINWCLYGVILLACAYILILPFLPKVTFTISTVIHGAPAKTLDKNQIDRNKNQLYIPSIRLTQPILEGMNPNTVNRGVWRLPGSSTPPQDSNTVLVGHRFSYKNPSIFYNLDKVKQGDNIYVSWDKKIYTYRVDAIRTVLPTAKDVEAPSKEAKLTIYSCTPLWSTSHRIVVVSNLEKVN